MKTPNPGGAVPDYVVRNIRDAYRALPHPSVRHRTIAGRDFQNLLDAAEFLYGRPAVAAIAPLTRQGIRAIVDRPPVKDADVIAYPEPGEVDALKQAWRDHVATNHLGRSVRRGSREFVAIQWALAPLRNKYDLRIIALAAKIPISRLMKFEDP